MVSIAPEGDLHRLRRTVLDGPHRRLLTTALRIHRAPLPLLPAPAEGTAAAATATAAERHSRYAMPNAVVVLSVFAPMHRVSLKAARQVDVIAQCCLCSWYASCLAV